MKETEGMVSLGACALLSPVPAVMLSCADEMLGRPNLVTVAWAGTVCSHPPMVSVSLRPERYSHGLIVKSGCFCVNLIGRPLCRAADFCGVRSGRDTDKFRETGLHPLAFPDFPAPAIAEAPAALLCRVTQRIPLGSHDLFLAEIRDVRVAPRLLDADGKLRMERAELVAYAHGEYYPLRGEPMGFFGYSVAGEEALRRRMPAGRNKKKEGKEPK